jgi:Zn ribbon nucleic-acid-binding protein
MSKKETPVKFNEFVTYLNSLKGDHACPMCQEESWTLFTPDQLTQGDDSENMIITTIPGAFFNAPKDKRSTLYRSPGLDILIMECQNCGFLHLFNYKKVEKNVASGEYVKENEGQVDES